MELVVFVIAMLALVYLFLRPFIRHSESTAPTPRTREQIDAAWAGRQLAADMTPFEELRELQQGNDEIHAKEVKRARNAVSTTSGDARAWRLRVLEPEPEKR